MTGALEWGLDLPLPGAVPAGRGTAVLLLGHCFHRAAPVAAMTLRIDGRAHAVRDVALPRPDVQAARGAGLRSGFWATVPVPARSAPGVVVVEADVRLVDGSRHTAELGRIPVVERAAPASPLLAPESAVGAGLIAVCMATFEPDLELFTRQVDSLRAQSDRRWVCVISDDCSTPEKLAAMHDVIGGDRRFALSAAPRRLSFYRNFERALGLAPAAAELVALCDQDDAWHPGKLAVLRAALRGGAVLAYSDQRLVDAHGGVLRDTLWHGRANNATNVSSELVANTITGAATLFRRDLADLAVPFPAYPGLQFHDHWLGVLAMTIGPVAYVDRPLYDYVQHGTAVFGDVTTSAGLARRRRAPALRGAVARARAAYFLGYVGRDVLARAALARAGDRAMPGAARALRRFSAADRSAWSLLSLAVRPLRSLAGRTETLGSERALVAGLLWRRGQALRARRGPATRRLLGDVACPPPDAFEQPRLRRWREGG